MEAVQMYEIHIFISSSSSFPSKLRANLITSPKLVSDPFMGFRNPGNFTLGIRNRGPALESRLIHLKEFEILLTIGIQNPSSTDKDWNPVTEIWTDPQRRIQNLGLSWIPQTWDNQSFLSCLNFFRRSFFTSSTVIIFFYNDNDNDNEK